MTTANAKPPSVRCPPLEPSEPVDALPANTGHTLRFGSNPPEAGPALKDTLAGDATVGDASAIGPAPNAGGSGDPNFNPARFQVVTFPPGLRGELIATRLPKLSPTDLQDTLPPHTPEGDAVEGLASSPAAPTEAALAGAEPAGAEPAGAGPTGAEPAGAGPTSAEPAGADPGDAEPPPKLESVPTQPAIHRVRKRRRIVQQIGFGILGALFASVAVWALSSLLSSDDDAQAPAPAEQIAHAESPVRAASDPVPPAHPTALLAPPSDIPPPPPAVQSTLTTDATPAADPAPAIEPSVQPARGKTSSSEPARAAAPRNPSFAATPASPAPAAQAPGTARTTASKVSSPAPTTKSIFADSLLRPPNDP